MPAACHGRGVALLLFVFLREDGRGALGTLFLCSANNKEEKSHWLLAKKNKTKQKSALWALLGL